MSESRETLKREIEEFQDDPVTFRKKEYQRKLAELEASASAAETIRDPFLAERLQKGIERQRTQLKTNYADVIDK